MVSISHSIPCRKVVAQGPQLKCRRGLHVSCESRTPRARRAPVVMRDLQLPGQSASVYSQQSGSPRQHQTQQNGNGATKQVQVRDRFERDQGRDQDRRSRDQDRRSSNSQASTSSYPQPQPAFRTRLPLKRSRQGINTLEASTEMEQAAPGFKAAARQASVTSDQLAQGMLLADQGVVPTLV